MDTPDPSTTILSDEYEPATDDPLSLRVVRLVAVASDRDPLDLPPLGETIDADALESLIDSQTTDSGVSLEATFVYAGYLVHIDEHGTLTLHQNVEEFPDQ